MGYQVRNLEYVPDFSSSYRNLWGFNDGREFSFSDNELMPYGTTPCYLLSKIWSGTSDLAIWGGDKGIRRLWLAARELAIGGLLMISQVVNNFS